MRARPRTESRELIKLDLPTLERPKNATSGFESRGQSASLKALLRNSALATFMRFSLRPSAYLCDLCVENTFYRRGRRDTQEGRRENSLIAGSGCGLGSGALLVERDQFLHALPDGRQPGLVIRAFLDNLFKVREKVWIAHLLAKRRNERL